MQTVSDSRRPLFCIFSFGPSGVRGLPLAAGRNEGGHYFRYFGPSGAVQMVSDSRRPLFCIFSPLLFFFSFLLLFLGPPLFKTTEGVVVLFQIFACGPKLPIE